MINTKKPISRFDFSEEEIEANKYIYDEYFDPEYLELLVDNVIQPISDYWFRIKYVDFDTVPKRNNPDVPLIFATNHSGMAFPWDAIIFNAMYSKKFGYGKNILRSLSAPMILAYRYMNPFFTVNSWKKVGCMDATYKNFDTAMRFPDHNILLYPEGVAGIAKGFKNKYQIQTIKASMVRIAIKYKTDIITFSTVNAEYNNPYTIRWKKLNFLVNKIGIPFLPVGIMTLVAVFQPYFFYFAFPAKMTYVRGKRIKAYEMIDKPYEEISPGEFKKISRKIQTIMQEQLTEHVKEYGKNPYQFGEFFKVAFQKLKHFHKFYFPLWAANTHEFEWQYNRKKEGDDFKYKSNIFRLVSIFFKKPILLTLYIPILGWIPLIYITLTDVNKLKKK